MGTVNASCSLHGQPLAPSLMQWQVFLAQEDRLWCHYQLRVCYSLVPSLNALPIFCVCGWGVHDPAIYLISKYMANSSSFYKILQDFIAFI